MKPLFSLIISILIGFSASAQSPADADMQNRMRIANQLMDLMKMETQLSAALSTTLDA